MKILDIIIKKYDYGHIQINRKNMQTLKDAKEEIEGALRKNRTHINDNQNKSKVDTK